MPGGMPGNTAFQLNASPEQGGVQLYPVPANDELTVEYDLPTTGKVNLSIFNQVGQLVHQQAVNQEAGRLKTQLNTADLPTGVYMLHIQQAGESMIQKFVKK